MIDLISNAYYADTDPEDRCAVRKRLAIPAMLREPGSKSFAVTVLDLSVAGFACEASTAMRPGARCWLTLPGLAGLQAELVWNDGIRIGAAFAELLNPAVHQQILGRRR